MVTTKFIPGDRVVFRGQSDEQRRWGNNSDASFLIVGKIYIVDQVEVHSHHTKLKLRNKQGMFNSVCFGLAG